MTTNRNSADMRTLIRHARRQMAAIRNNRGGFATPGKWADVEGRRMRDRAAQQADYARVDRQQAVAAAQWAVADARRRDNPDLARRADANLNDRYGISAADLEYEREIAWREGQLDAERRAAQNNGAEHSSVGTNLVAATAAMVVSAELYENAWDWDEQSPEALNNTVEQWPEPENVVDVSDLPEVEQIEPAQIPEGLFPYSIEEQMAHVAENGGSPAAEAGASPEVAAGVDVSPDAGPSV